MNPSVFQAYELSEWHPSYGDPHEFGHQSDEPAVLVEGSHWDVKAGLADSLRPPLAFVDGVRNIEAYLHPTTAGQPAPESERESGLAVTLAAGAVLPKSPHDPRLTYSHFVIEKLLIGRGLRSELASGPSGLEWGMLDSGEEEPQMRALKRLREIESEVAAQLAATGIVVICDGPLQANHLSYQSLAAQLVGYVKTQSQSIVNGPGPELLSRLLPRMRTSVFRWQGRYACFLRLGNPSSQPSSGWRGVIRLECSDAVAAPKAIQLLSTVATHLPDFGSEPHYEPRAPQNLQPIISLERELRKRLGDRKLSLRYLRDRANAS